MSVTKWVSSGPHLWTLPVNIDVHTPVTFELKGAGGGNGSGGGTGGVGGHVIGTFDISALTPGVSQLQINVGGPGHAHKGGTGGAGGFNGGGAGGHDAAGTGGDGGGGASDVRVGGTALGNRQIVAGGGGGAPAFAAVNGGAGGAGTGGDGGSGSAGTGGHGGTGAAGGVGGTSTGGLASGTAGSSGIGGHGSYNTSAGVFTGGGGGGGYFGGGGGGGSLAAGSEGAGGGGSNYVGGLASVTTNARGGGSAVGVVGSVSATYNLVPNAPTVDTGTTFAVEDDLALHFDFTDPDPGDTLSAAVIQWRVGAGAWTTISGLTVGAGLTTNGTGRYAYVFTAGTFTAEVGSTIEVQVATLDENNAQGAWSASSFFPAVHAPANPVIVYPLASTPDVIDNNVLTVSATYPDAAIVAQVRVLNDVSGSAGTTVLLDTGALTAAFAAGSTDDTALASYAYVNGTAYHVQVRYQKDAGVWSVWVDSGAVVADINAPLAPSAVLSPDVATASVSLTVTNPGADPFPPVHNDIYRDDLVTGDVVRIATGIAVDGSYVDYTTGFNRPYRYRAVAVTATGAFTSST